MPTDLTLLSQTGQVTITKGDNQINIDFALTDADAAVVNLTGAIVTFKMALPEASRLKVDKDCTIISATGGTCRVTLFSTDLDTASTYLAELQITFSTGRIVTIRDLIVKVAGELPRGRAG